MDSTLLQDVVDGRAPDVLPLSVEQYHQMLTSYILTDGEPVELIEGMLVRKNRGHAGEDSMIHGPHHALVLTRLHRVLDRQVEQHGCHVRNQLPVTLASDTEPEPDLAVVSGIPDDFQARHPRPQDVLVAIEIADSSLQYDQTTKQRVYASAGIPVFWTVNLPQRRIEVYEDPVVADGSYGAKHSFGPGENVPVNLGSDVGIEVAVSDVL